MDTPQDHPDTLLCYKGVDHSLGLAMDQFIDPARSKKDIYTNHVSVLDQAITSLKVVDKNEGINNKQPVSAEQMLRDFSSRVASSQMSWFSVLPRRTCDKQSETKPVVPGSPLIVDYTSNCSSGSSPMSRTSGTITPNIMNSTLLNTSDTDSMGYRARIMEDLQYDTPQEIPEGELLPSAIMKGIG